MSSTLQIQSHRGPYEVVFDDDALNRLTGDEYKSAHFIIDKRLASLHPEPLADIAASGSTLALDATEEAKTFDRMGAYIDFLLERRVRRSDVIVAVGGGIIQDISCFLASTVLRGVPWHFFPTTLLAQADSCIGSKSSINVDQAKNLLGTFFPPKKVVVTSRVLNTLDPRDMRSGVGEMLKIHAIRGPAAFDGIAADYKRLFEDRGCMAKYVRASLELKIPFVEQDEFDQGIRNVLNYGHSFGHAIESATSFAVPHGIAVTLGMDLANYAALHLGKTSRGHFERMHQTLKTNYAGFEGVPMPLDAVLGALAKDKKNTSAALRLVLPGENGEIGLVTVDPDDRFASACRDFLTTARM